MSPNLHFNLQIEMPKKCELRSEMGLLNTLLQIGTPGHEATLDMPSVSSGSTEASSTNAREKDDHLSKLEDECFEALKEAVTREHPDLKSCFSALPSECYQGSMGSSVEFV